LQRARVADLLEKAKEERLISESEFTVFNKVRKIRNPIIHFCKSNDKEIIEYRAVKNDRYPHKLLEEDSKTALKANFRIMSKFSIPKHRD